MIISIAEECFQGFSFGPKDSDDTFEPSPKHQQSGSLELHLSLELQSPGGLGVPCSSSSPHRARLMPVHHRGPWFSPNISRPRTPCRDTYRFTCGSQPQYERAVGVLTEKMKLELLVVTVVLAEEEE